ncbi:TetR/AcrR family transcriptional regulator [Conexibacter woesei]|uniref:TetR/AcrR family transcriptional regulator n=1 Tax=Conexibacter woesei TaxID=191495 RepID=UPI00041666CB|nr:TetR/AcrR family transcriptional regulator [Conexibacter woesei]
MAYRPTERTEAKRAQTRAQIVRAAGELVARGGYREAQVAEVARRAGVATGTVYRHFPSKADLFTEVFRVASQREVDAVAEAAGTAGQSAAAERIERAVSTFAARALQGRRLAWALLAEPVDPAVEAERLQFRRAYAAVFQQIIEDGIQHHQLPEQDAGFTATALVGAIGEALVGPLSPTHAPADADALIAHLTTFCLRATT